MGILKHIRAFKRFYDDVNSREPVREFAPKIRHHQVDSAPDLFDLMSRCIDAHKQNILAGLESGVDVGHSWRHTLEELIHSGAFSANQIEVLNKQVNIAEREIASKSVHIQATKIIFGVKDEDYYTDYTVKIAGANSAAPLSSNSKHIYVTNTQNPWK